MRASIDHQGVGTAATRTWCDSHFHVYDPRFDYAVDATLRPPPAPAAVYADLQLTLGLRRGVVVQPSSYGVDNRCTLSAVQTLGLTNTRAVVVLDGNESDVCLLDMNESGARGLRVNALRGNTLNRARLQRLCARVAELGWHLQLHVDGTALPDLAPWIKCLPLPVVLDHFARMPIDRASQQPVWPALRGLLDTGKTWVKLSAPYLISKLGPPSYQDLHEPLDALLAHAPHRMLWGSDWPHPGWPAGPHAPLSAQQLLDFAVARFEAHGCTESVLDHNPCELYGF